MKTQWLLRECFSVILEGEFHLMQLSQLVSTIPVSVGILCIIGIHIYLSPEVSWSLYVCQR